METSLNQSMKRKALMTLSLMSKSRESATLLHKSSQLSLCSRNTTNGSNSMMSQPSQSMRLCKKLWDVLRPNVQNVKHKPKENVLNAKNTCVKKNSKDWSKNAIARSSLSSNSNVRRSVKPSSLRWLKSRSFERLKNKILRDSAKKTRKWPSKNRE